MGNIDFSKEGKLILSNPALAQHLTLRLSNLTLKEEKEGVIAIKLRNRDKDYTLNVRIAPERKSYKNQPS